MLAKFLTGEWIAETEYKQLLLALNPPLTESILIDAICRGDIALETTTDLYRGNLVRCVNGAAFIEDLRAKDAAVRMTRLAA